MVTFSVDGMAVGMGTVTGGTATLTITPTPATLKPGNHTLTATYSGNTSLTSSTSTPVTIAPTLPSLTTMVTRKHGRFIWRCSTTGRSCNSSR